MNKKHEKQVASNLGKTRPKQGKGKGKGEGEGKGMAHVQSRYYTFNAEKREGRGGGGGKRTRPKYDAHLQSREKGRGMERHTSNKFSTLSNFSTLGNLIKEQLSLRTFGQ